MNVNEYPGPEHAGRVLEICDKAIELAEQRLRFVPGVAADVPVPRVRHRLLIENGRQPRIAFCCLEQEVAELKKRLGMESERPTD